MPRPIAISHRAVMVYPDLKLLQVNEKPVLLSPHRQKKLRRLRAYLDRNDELGGGHKHEWTKDDYWRGRHFPRDRLYLRDFRKTLKHSTRWCKNITLAMASFVHPSTDQLHHRLYIDARYPGEILGNRPWTNIERHFKLTDLEWTDLLSDESLEGLSKRSLEVLYGLERLRRRDGTDSIMQIDDQVYTPNVVALATQALKTARAQALGRYLIPVQLPAATDGDQAVESCCGICHCEYASHGDGEETCKNPVKVRCPCFQSFGADCLGQWIWNSTNPSCPSCRTRSPWDPWCGRT